MQLLSVAAIVFASNLPFGYWRTHVDRYSKQWFLAIHLPVPLVIALRLLAGLGWQLSTFPIMIGSFFAGQFFGGIWYHCYVKLGRGRVSSCLVMDLLNRLPTRRPSGD